MMVFIWGIAIWNILLAIAVVYLYIRKNKVDGYKFEVKNERLIIRDKEDKIIFNTGK